MRTHQLRTDRLRTRRLRTDRVRVVGLVNAPEIAEKRPSNLGTSGDKRRGTSDRSASGDRSALTMPAVGARCRFR